VAEDITPDEVQHLLVTRLRTVLAHEGDISAAARFDEDLHADSLDLVEVIEGVERDLAERGLTAALDDEELLELETVGDAVRRIHAAATPS
jgi:acyl carrier protein